MRKTKGSIVVYQGTVVVTTAAGKVEFKDITDGVKDILAASDIENGIVTIQTTHTTCSIIFEEYVHDYNWQGQEYLQADLIHFLDKLIPRETEENREYRYPGPKHVEFLAEYAKENPGFPDEPASILNGDAHLRGSLLGSSQTFVVTDGVIQTGEFGHIYLADWDMNRERTRTALVCVIGE